MDFIINLLVSAGVLLLLAYIMPQVHVKSFLTALWVALLIGILNATIGLLLRFIGNLFTLFLLSFIIKLIVTAIVIKIADKLTRNFEVKGFWPALVIAIALAIASTLVDRTRADEDYDNEAFLPARQEQLIVLK
ncbi:phage holin family protein [Adhaeribacter rhizoryzae]|uniref:Phage holin family protein n=1 Tax=Adhaeribacter rhizoryzae TaxID=2607907 RepID=A0A5M6DNC3_9BACT|nr:phage holin family protein [Adhaeribacter rhizoryzae]KAA5547759.1 phage holin family protein [Adhaeribacter rhizoryzae]